MLTKASPPPLSHSPMRVNEKREKQWLDGVDRQVWDALSSPLPIQEKAGPDLAILLDYPAGFQNLKNPLAFFPLCEEQLVCARSGVKRDLS